MTRQELRVFLSEWFCGCGSPDAACRALRDLLAVHDLEDDRYDAMVKLLPDEGLRYLTLYTLDHFDLTEHGGSVGGAWLTDKGRMVLAALNAEAGDDFAALSESCCIHGYSVEGDEFECPECRKLNERTND